MHRKLRLLSGSIGFPIEGEEGFCHGFAIMAMFAHQAMDFDTFRERIRSMQGIASDEILKPLNEAKEKRHRAWLLSKLKIMQNWSKTQETVQINIQKKLTEKQRDKIIAQWGIFKEKLSKLSKEDRDKIEKELTTNYQNYIDGFPKKIQDALRFDVETFFEGVWRYQNPREFSKIFSKKELTQDDTALISKFVSPLSLDQKVFDKNKEEVMDENKVEETISKPILQSVKTSNTISGIYKKDELTQYFSSLQKAIPSSYTAPVTILLSSPNHTINVTYYSSEQRWVCVDANQMGENPLFPKIKLEELVQKVLDSFIFSTSKNPFSTDFITYSPNFYCLSEDLSKLQACINQWEASEEIKRLQTVTKEKATKRVDSDDQSWLLTASICNDIIHVRELLEAGSNPNLVNKENVSPLFKAAQKGHTDIVKLLLEKGANPNLVNQENDSPLFMAAQEGHTDIVKLLLEKGANPNLVNKENVSPLSMAAQEGYTDIVKLLLEKNANPNLVNKENTSPLSMAAQEGYTDIVKLLLEKNANPNLANKMNVSPLFVAAQRGHTDTVKLLIKKAKLTQSQVFEIKIDKARQVAKTMNNVDSMEKLIQAKLKLNPSATKIPITPLEIAMVRGYKEIVNILKEKIIQEYTDTIVKLQDLPKAFSDKMLQFSRQASVDEESFNHLQAAMATLKILEEHSQWLTQLNSQYSSRNENRKNALRSLKNLLDKAYKNFSQADPEEYKKILEDLNENALKICANVKADHEAHGTFVFFGTKSILAQAIAQEFEGEIFANFANDRIFTTSGVEKKRSDISRF